MVGEKGRSLGSHSWPIVVVFQGSFGDSISQHLNNQIGIVVSCEHVTAIMMMFNLLERVTPNRNLPRNPHCRHSDLVIPFSFQSELNGNKLVNEVHFTMNDEHSTFYCIIAGVKTRFNSTGLILGTATQIPRPFIGDFGVILVNCVF